MNAPCKDCKDRCQNCHSTCERYIEFRKWRDQFNAKRYEERNRQRAVNEKMFNDFFKYKRRQHLKSK